MVAKLCALNFVQFFLEHPVVSDNSALPAIPLSVADHNLPVMAHT